MDTNGLYLYCLAGGEREEPLDLKGIGGASVQTLSHQGLMAVVQECEPKPFHSEDQKALADWLLIHQNIVDLAWERYETIIPFGFDTIIVPTEGRSARRNLEEWLEKESETIKQKLGRLKNKVEYGIQISWDPNVILPRIKKQDGEIKKLEGEISSKPSGIAYLLQKKLEELIRQRLETMADAYFKIFYKQIHNCVENIHIEKTRKVEPPKQMIMNVSCLQNREEKAALGAVLEKIGGMPGFEVSFTGPWPPYSFVDG